VTVGRLVPWKQVDQIIQAIAQCDGVGLVIVGDGPEHRRLEELVHAWDLADRVYFAGRRSKAETFSLMAACDLFVLNSTYEGLPHVVLEALSLGLPVVATAVGGTPEVVRNGENGLLIPLMADELLSQTLLHLVTFPEERQRMASEARHSMERFCPMAMLEGTEYVLRNSISLR
jgi:glycosyltransferase involved in cell wall biosynthesis